MNPRVLTAIAAWTAILIPSQGCGPFFPDTVLDRPQAALDVPPVSYLHGLYQLTGRPLPAEGGIDGNAENPFLHQIPLESAELRDLWRQAGVGSEEIDRRIHHYESVRQQLLTPIIDAGGMDFPTHGDAPPTLPIRPLGAEFPADVADYVEAARLHACGKSADARTLWKSILECPPTERKLRAAWAAWMLAKTSPDIAECLDWYARVETEIAAGATDAIGLRGAAKAWRAAKMDNDPVQALQFYHDAFAGGKDTAAIDIRRISRKLLDRADAATFATAAANPLIRRLINLALHASLDGPRQMEIEPVTAGARQSPPAEWLAALEAHAERPLDDGPRVAWALYSAGRFDESRKWLALSPKDDPLGRWLQAKFDLRDGNLDAANQHLTEAVNAQSKDADWKPQNPYLEQLWHDAREERQGAHQGRLLADAGIVALARKDYLSALESLRHGGYREDAMYLAESVISTDGLIKHVRKVAPAWSVPPERNETIDPYTCLTSSFSFYPNRIGPDNQLRYLLARRLAREKRLKEAREFMPPELLPLLDHYIALDRARRSGRYSGEAGAAVAWRQALIHRHFGAELFSTDGAPDGGAREWMFPATDFSVARSFQNGWSRDWSRDTLFAAAEKPGDQAIPSVTTDEIRRVGLYAVSSTQRFHYRYAAADLAWEAGRMLPKNHPLLPRLYNTAGQWLSARDPKAADRFYQAMIRRCAKSPEDQAADAKRWFLTDLEPLADLPALPARFTKETTPYPPPPMTPKLPAAGFILALLSVPLSAADVVAEMRRAEEFGKSAPSLLLRNELKTYWLADDSLLVYRIDTGRGEHRFFKIDPASGAKSPAFDHEALAAALGKATNANILPNKLPVEQFEPGTDSFRFRAFGKSWRYHTADQQVSPDGQPPQDAELVAPEETMRSPRRSDEATELTIENGTAGEIELFWVDASGERKSYGKLPAGQNSTQQTYAGHVWLLADASGQPLAGVKAPDTPSYARVTERVKPRPRPKDNLSPDGKWRALILNHNVVIEPAASGASVSLSSDGTENDFYTRPLKWSPDSKSLVAFREKKVEPRKIQIVQSSPPDQLQPKLKTIDYPKPGDAIPQPMPRLFDVEHHREIAIDTALFGNPWEISDLEWAADSLEFSFVYNQRGHQVMRVVAIRADSGSARTIIEDTSKTFIDYSQKFFIRRLPATNEILWASERAGYNHLYLIDCVSGEIKNSITKGNWNVREVVDVDTERRELLLKVIGMTGQDPYHEHFARVNFDGSGFIQLTSGDGTHRIEFSPKRRFIVDTWSRVDQPPVVELRRADDGKLVAELERADDSALIQTGWSRPQRFTAKGRDGKTDIHGIIIRPVSFNPSKKYPVVEDIYAGPHDHFVPKAYFPWSGKNAMAELGFVIVSIDGMGTNWRSKAFHDVCWKNLMDSGFPDRIPWIKAAAASRPWMDLTRVGIYGGSAGGQSTLAGLLDHGDFYQVGVSDCGCHDNRMDKIWWNEAWMGWPVDESYERNSNVTHVAKLKGKLMLVVGELDTNVDPASTAQVVAALQKANKDFEYLPIMNAGHGAAETSYGKRRRAEFLVRNLQGPADAD